MTRFAAAAAGLLATAIVILTEAETGATGSVCFEKRAARANHTVQKYFPAAGWGWTNWALRANVNAVDS
jgi:hypothetical protein